MLFSSLIHFYHDCFDWPTGVVVGNLLASLIWVPVQWVGVHARLRAHHREMHDRMDAQDLVLADLRNLLTGGNADLLPDHEGHSITG